MTASLGAGDGAKARIKGFWSEPSSGAERGVCMGVEVGAGVNVALGVVSVTCNGNEHPSVNKSVNRTKVFLFLQVCMYARILTLL